MKKAFTLIELLMVVAIIGIISTLAVSKLGGVREAAARKVSLANQKAVERAVEAYLTAHQQEGVSRLDSLVYASQTDEPQSSGSIGKFNFSDTTLLYKGPTDDFSEEVLNKNSGLTPELLNALCIYTLNTSDVNALRRLGFRYVTQFTASAYKAPGYAGYSSDTQNANADGTIPTADNGLDPLLSACLVRSVKEGMPVAAITPCNNMGRLIYQACGIDLPITNSVSRAGQNFMTERLYNYGDDEAKTAVDAAGGILLAFGLGDNATIIGKSDAGLDNAPYATFVHNRYYSRYILLFRLKKIGSGSVAQVLAEFAGVIDCEGNTLRAAQHIIKNS